MSSLMFELGIFAVMIIVHVMLQVWLKKAVRRLSVMGCPRAFVMVSMGLEGGLMTRRMLEWVMTRIAMLVWCYAVCDSMTVEMQECFEELVARAAIASAMIVAVFFSLIRYARRMKTSKKEDDKERRIVEK